MRWTPVQAYDLVADVDSYPDFLPGWRHARVVARDNNRAEVEQQIGIGPLTLRFDSTATFVPHTRIVIRSRAKPFVSLDLRWSFTPLGDGCRVDLVIDAEFRSRAMALSAAPVMDALTQRIMTAFERRARCLYEV